MRHVVFSGFHILRPNAQIQYLAKICLYFKILQTVCIYTLPCARQYQISLSTASQLTVDLFLKKKIIFLLHSCLHPGCCSDAEAEHCFRMAESSKSDAPIRERVHVPSALRKKRQEYQQGDRSYAGHLTRYDTLFWLTSLQKLTLHKNVGWQLLLSL